MGTQDKVKQVVGGLATGLTGTATGVTTSNATATGNNTTASNNSGGYKESTDVQRAMEAYNNHLNNKPAEYTSQWQTQLNDIMGKITSREPFSYDVNGDALYQQYKDQYINQGKMAMADTMGQAAAMTGGYGNSYAATVGNQAYQASLQQLNNVIPELYQMAYDRYTQEGQDLLNQYGIYSDREATDYGRWSDDRNFNESVRQFEVQTATSKDTNTGKYVPTEKATPTMSTDDYDYWSSAFSDITTEAQAKALRDQMAIAVGDKNMAYELFYQWEEANKNKNNNKNKTYSHGFFTDMIN